MNTFTRIIVSAPNGDGPKTNIRARYEKIQDYKMMAILVACVIVHGRLNTILGCY